MQEICLPGSEGGAKLSFVPTPIRSDPVDRLSNSFLIRPFHISSWRAPICRLNAFWISQIDASYSLHIARVVSLVRFC